MVPRAGRRRDPSAHPGRGPDGRPRPGPARGPGTGTRPTGYVRRSRPPAGRSPTRHRFRPDARRAARRGRGRRIRYGPPPTCRRAWRSRPRAWPRSSSSPRTGRMTWVATLAGLRATSPAGTSVVVVADGPSAEQAAALEANEPRRDGPRAPGGGRVDVRAAGPGAARTSASAGPAPRSSSCSRRASNRPATS